MIQLLAEAATADVSSIFLYASLVLAIGMLIWDTFEVGRNDAVNMTNAVYGARILSRRNVVLVAGVGVVAGATFSAGVIETAQKGIFNPTILTMQQALAIYVSVYLVDTILLYSYSAYGMPISTTACLIFELLGAAFALEYFKVVKWGPAGEVIAGIVLSIILSGIAAFLIQRAVRGAIRDKTSQLTTLLLHGGWVGGGMCAGLIYYMLLKGMKTIEAVKQFQAQINDGIGEIWFVLILWGLFAIVIHLLLVLFRKKAAQVLFPFIAIMGMLCLAFAFGQNDLANGVAPGLAVIKLFREGSVAAATEAEIPQWGLFLCGVLLVAGMLTKNSYRVTKAEVRSGSQTDQVALWAPRWCISLASLFLEKFTRADSLAPRQTYTATGKKLHYDVLRACTITAVSACVIATASSRKLPVSTTYVTFAAMLATGMADRVFQRGDSALKLGRIFWVIASWFFSAIIAAIFTALVCRVIYHLEVPGMLICLGANFYVRRIAQHRADLQEKRAEEEAYERAHPEEFALEEA